MMIQFEVMSIIVVAVAIVLVALIKYITSMVACNKMFDSMTEWLEDMWKYLKED